MLADDVAFVLGVDTHADSHALALVEAATQRTNRCLAARGECLLEVERPSRGGRQGRLKSDSLDAEQAARQVLVDSAGALPRVGQDTQALRALLSTREGAVTACTAALNELRALIESSAGGECASQLIAPTAHALDPAAWALATTGEIVLHRRARDRLTKQFLDSCVDLSHPHVRSSVCQDLNDRITNLGKATPALGCPHRFPARRTHPSPVTSAQTL